MAFRFHPDGQRFVDPGKLKFAFDWVFNPPHLIGYMPDFKSRGEAIVHLPEGQVYRIDVDYYECGNLGTYEFVKLFGKPKRWIVEFWEL